MKSFFAEELECKLLEKNRRMKSTSWMGALLQMIFFLMKLLQALVDLF